MTDILRAITEGETGEKFAAFYALLTEYNEKVNLTRIVGEEDCRIKHFYDSLLGEPAFLPARAAPRWVRGAASPPFPS